MPSEPKAQLTTTPSLSTPWRNAKTYEELKAVITQNRKTLEAYYQNNKDHFVLVNPEHFDIPKQENTAGNGFLDKGPQEWNRNPDANRKQVVKQWGEFKSKLEELGAKVTVSPSTKGSVDQIFRADPSLSVSYINSEGKSTGRPTVHVGSTFSHPNRGEEIIDARRAFKEGDFSNCIITSIPDHNLEGTGDNLIDTTRNIIVSGDGERNKGAGEALAKKTGLSVYTVKTQDPFFHIDTFCAVLPTGHVIYAEDAINPDSTTQLKQAFFKKDAKLEKEYSIKVSKDLAHAFFCNLVVVGTKDIIVQEPYKDMLFPEGTSYEKAKKDFDKVKQQLATLGYTVHPMDTHLLNLSGGSFHCISNKVNHPVIDSRELTPAQQARNQFLTDRQNPNAITNSEVKEKMGLAATKIQKVARGHIARTSLASQRKEKGNGAPAVLVVQPRNFVPNPETAQTNHFQKQSTPSDSTTALTQHKTLVEALRAQNVAVHVIKGKNEIFGTKEPNIPDEAFPNNWFSTHTNPATKKDVLVLYPMHHDNRRKERKWDITEGLKAIAGNNVIDLTTYETQGKALEGTGSLVFDHINHHVYMCRSQRSNVTVLNDLLRQLEEKLGIKYEPVIFDAKDQKGEPVYHTNVMMAVGTGLSVACLESIPETSVQDKKEGIKTRQEVKEILTRNNTKLIELTRAQMSSFAGNMFELQNAKGEPVLVMSKTAFDSLGKEQKQMLNSHYNNRIVAVDFSAIEKAGRSVRCALAALNTTKSNAFISTALQRNCPTSYIHPPVINSVKTSRAV